MMAGAAAPPNVVINVLSLRAPSIRRVNGTGWACFDDLPPECVEGIAAFLPATDVLRLQSVSKRCREAGDSAEVWGHLLARDFTNEQGKPQRAVSRSLRTLLSRRVEILAAINNTGNGNAAANNDAPATGADKTAEGDAAAKKRYKQRFQEHLRLTRHQKEEREREHVHAAAARRGLRLRCCFDVAEFGCGMVGPAVLVVLWLFLLWAKLAGHTGISIDAVWAPYWAAVALVVVCSAVGCCIIKQSRWATRASAMYQQDNGSEAGLGGRLRTSWRDATQHDNCPEYLLRFLWFFTFVACAFVVFPALLQAKLSGVLANVHWAAIFAPVWICFFIWCCFFAAAKRCFDDRDIPKLFQMITCGCVFLPLLAVLVMIIVRLEGKFIASSLMFIPFWILDVLLAMLGCFGLAMGGYFDRHSSDRTTECGVGLAACCVLGTFMPLQIIASLNDAKGEAISSNAMISLLVGACIAACGVFCWAGVNLAESRDDYFKGAWSWRTWCGGARQTGPVIPGAPGRSFFRN